MDFLNLRIGERVYAINKTFCRDRSQADQRRCYGCAELAGSNHAGERNYVVFGDVAHLTSGHYAGERNGNRLRYRSDLAVRNDAIFSRVVCFSDRANATGSRNAGERNCDAAARSP